MRFSYCSECPKWMSGSLLPKEISRGREGAHTTVVSRREPGMSCEDEIDVIAIAAEVERRIRQQKDDDFAAAHDGAVMLDLLWQKLQPFQRRHDAYIDKGPEEEEKAVNIEQGGKLVATWTRRGRTLIFTSRAGGAEVQSVAKGIAVTLEFLATGTSPSLVTERKKIGFL